VETTSGDIFAAPVPTPKADVRMAASGDRPSYSSPETSGADGQPPRLEELFNADHSPAYGEAVQVAPLVQRVTAANPSPFTFAGTGTYIVGGPRVAVIDPGPDDAAHVASLLRAVEGRTVTHICITHTHSDHSPASRALAKVTGAPVLGFGPHPASDAGRQGSGGSAVQEEPGDWDFTPDGVLGHGDVVDGDGWTLECLHTPGHISNHLCFALAEEAALFTGDHVMGWSSTIIPPPDGNLGDYLRSLELLIGRGDRDAVYWPTHGPPVTAPIRYARALLAHRHRRTAQILDCLRDGPATIPAMVARLYTTTPKILHPAAALSVLAHLIHLGEEGRVTSDSAADVRAATYALA
jgi:glyoxylase-like metal-dependent hydrolase (beta-lactamase superfamily II)